MDLPTSTNASSTSPTKVLEFLLECHPDTSHQSITHIAISANPARSAFEVPTCKSFCIDETGLSLGPQPRRISHESVEHQREQAARCLLELSSLIAQSPNSTGLAAVIQPTPQPQIAAAKARARKVRNDIHKEGSKGVSALLALSSDAHKSSDARAGDVILDGRYIEVKTTANVTVAQVRAVKYIPLVVHQSARDEWYVIAPHEVVQMAAEKPRGQHTENPFECAMLICPKPGSSHWQRWQKWRTQPEDLQAHIRRAISAGDLHLDVQGAMDETIAQAKYLAEQTKVLVKRMLT